MPWTDADALRHTKKAKTPRLKAMWSNVANGVLKSTGDEARAVREANGAVQDAVMRARAGGGRKPKKNRVHG